MTIDSTFYRNDIKTALRGGALNVTEIKKALADKGIKLDEIQILEALDALIKNNSVVRSDGKFALRTVF